MNDIVSFRDDKSAHSEDGMLLLALDTMDDLGCGEADDEGGSTDASTKDTDSRTLPRQNN